MGPDLLGDDTICAVATGSGGALGIVRISGPAAEAILARLAPSLASAAPGSQGPAVAPTRPPTRLESHALGRVTLRDPVGGEPIDEVLACVMRAPRSYTGETVVELQGHGGEANLQRLLASVLQAGARLARPGEFTQRAFLAGRIDLAQAEAVAGVIAARSQRALRVAHAQLRGSLSGAVAALGTRLVALLAEVEASVDFPDERLDLPSPAALADEAGAIAAEASRLAGSHGRGRLLVEGIDVALVGRANAGKSSLLNALAGEERALVDEAPGTTRDFLEVELLLGDQRAVLVDTAGERDAPGALEERGLALGRRRRDRADVVVVVVDGTVGVAAIERGLLEEALAAGARPVIAWNKSDLTPPGAEPLPSLSPDLPVIATAAPTGLGVAELARAIRGAGLGEATLDEGEVVTSARQRELLEGVAQAAAEAAGTLGRGGAPELAAPDLRAALDRVGQITGQSFDAEVLDRIFSRFCIGK